MSRCVLARLGHHRDVQASADDFSDVTDRNTFVSDSVIAGSCFAFLQRKPVQSSGVEPMHRWPTIVSFSRIGRNTLFSRNMDESRNEAMIPYTMHRGRKAHD